MVPSVCGDAPTCAAATLAGARRACAGLAVAFVGLNLADLLLTRRLLSQPHSVGAEVNPLANWLLGRHGWPALCGLKLGTTALVLGTLGRVAARRRRLGLGVLTCACVLLGGVVAYNLALNYCPEAVASGPWTEMHITSGEAHRLDAQMQGLFERDRWNQGLAREFVRGRWTLAEALNRQVERDFGDPSRLRLLRMRFPDCTDAEGSALSFLHRVLLYEGDEPWAAAQKWAAVYATHYGTPIPPAWWRL